MGWGSCQPDGLITGGSCLVIVEIKIRNIPEVCEQIETYLKVGEALFRNKPRAVLIVKHYDPMMGFPMPITLQGLAIIDNIQRVAQGVLPVIPWWRRDTLSTLEQPSGSSLSPGDPCPGRHSV
jgi:hypothetical protein